MRCPNCSAECSDQTVECDFCGHVFVEATETPAVTPAEPATSPGRAVFTASEPTYSTPEPSYRPPPTPPQAPPPISSENPYAASYPSSSKAAGASYAKGSVPNYLVWAILATLCCCIPGGIVAVVYAAQVDGKLAAGDYEGAVSASNNAKLWSWIAFGIGGLINLVYFIAMFTGGLAESGRY